MPQYLDMTYGISNDWQAEELVRDWHEGEQIKKQDQLIVFAVGNALQSQGPSQRWRGYSTSDQWNHKMESISNVASQATGPVPSKGKSRTCLAHVYTVGNQATRDENDPCLDQAKGSQNSKWWLRWLTEPRVCGSHRKTYHLKRRALGNRCGKLEDQFLNSIWEPLTLF